MHHRSIAIICAFPTGLNAGMLSVDLAAHQLLNTIKKVQTITTTFFTTEARIAFSIGNKNHLKYELLHDQSQLDKFDLILYWGDFGHWIKFAQNEWLKRQYDRQGKAQKTLSNWYKLYFLKGREDLMKKTIIYGGSIYGLDCKQIEDQEYVNSLKSLFSQCIWCSFRDIYSVNYINQLINKSKAELGADCSLLMTNELANSLTRYQNKMMPEEEYILSSFGRSNSGFLLNSLCYQLSEELKIKLVNFNWLDERYPFSSKLELITNCKILVTDIYHCALNGIREEKKVVCFGKGNSRKTDTLSDKKKEVFFSQHMMSKNYYFIEEVHEASKAGEHAMKRLINSVIDISNDSLYNKTSLNLIKHLSETSKKKLLEVINQALS